MVLSSGVVPAQIAVIAPADVTAGQKTAMQVEALDSQGNVLSNFTGTIHLSSNDAKAHLPSQVTFKKSDHSIHSFNATFDTAGNESITATDTADAVSGQASLVVAPGAAHKFEISAPSAVTAGQTISLTVTALDKYGNLATGYTGTVHFSSNDHKAQLPSDYTFTTADQGNHTFSFSLARGGRDSLKVTDSADGHIEGKTKIKVTFPPFVTEDNSTPATGQSLRVTSLNPSGKKTSVNDYTLDNGVLSVNGQQIETGVLSFAVGAVSSNAKVEYLVYYVTTDGHLYQVGGDGNPLAGGVTSLAATSSGQVYYVATDPATGGDLYALGSGLIDSGITCVVAAGNNAYYLTTTGNLYQMGEAYIVPPPSSSGISPDIIIAPPPLASSVTSLAAAGGNTYYLTTTGDLYQVGGGSSLASNVTSLAAADGNAYYLTAAGDLYQMPQTDISPPTTGGISPYIVIAPLHLASHVTSLAATSGNAFYLTEPGDLYQVGIGSSRTSSVNTLAAAGDDVYYLTASGDLFQLGEAYLFPPPSSSGISPYIVIAPAPLAANVTSLSVASNNAFYLTATSNLYQVGDSSPLSSGVSSFAVSSDGSLYVLHTNRDLVLESSSGQQVADFGTVQKFAIGNDGKAYYLASGLSVTNNAFLLHSGTALSENDGPFTYQMVDWNHDGVSDLVAIKTGNTGSGMVEVHVLDGASGFQKFLVHAATAISENDGPFTFLMTDWNHDGVADLVAIKTGNTGTGTVEVHVLDGASGFQKFLVHAGTALSENDGPFTYQVADWNHDGVPDLVAIKTGNTGTGTVEVHVLDGASGFQKFLVHSGTALSENDGPFTFRITDWNHDGVPDLVAIKTGNTGTNTVEVHVLDGASGFQNFLVHAGTALSEYDGPFTYQVTDWNNDGTPNLVAIKTGNTGTGTVEVHVLADNFGVVLTNNLYIAGKTTQTSSPFTPFVSGVQSFAWTKAGLVYLSSLSTNSGYAPGYSAQYLQRGSSVTIYGSGFLPGTEIQFGIGGPLAVPTAMAPNGTWLTINVPRFAPSGPLAVILPEGTVLQSMQSFTVHDYINTFGFNFANYNFNVTWGMVKGEFGGDQVDITAGIPFTSLQFDTGVPSPFGLAYWGVVAAIFNGNGACFGMALTSDLLAAQGQNVYSLPKTGGLLESIDQNHLAQTSAEMLHYAAGWAISGHNSQGIYNQLLGLLASGDHPIITLGSGGSGHAVVAYDVEPGYKGNGDYYIDVYDPNLPFGSASEQYSRIYIDPSSGWSYAPLDWSGGYGPFGMMVVPTNLLSGQLTMPATLEGLAKIVFGYGAPLTPKSNVSSTSA